MFTRIRPAVPLLAVALLVAGLAASVGCERERTYLQSTPEATVDSFFAMVRAGDIERVPELIRADDERLDGLLDRAGGLAQRLVDLARTIEEEYPHLVEDAREMAETEGVERAEEEGRRRGRRDWGLRLQRLLADPGETIDDEISRVSVVEIDEETFAVTIDDRPAFGVGLLLVRHPEDGKWYLDWPDRIPGLDTAMPRTDAEWRIMNAVFTSIGKGVEWAEIRVAEGDLGSLEDVWEEAAKYVVPNIVVSWAIYEQALEHRPDETTETETADENDR